MVDFRLPCSCSFQRNRDMLLPREVQPLSARELEQAFSQGFSTHGLDEGVYEEFDGGEGEDDEVAHDWGIRQAWGQVHDHGGRWGKDGD